MKKNIIIASLAFSSLVNAQVKELKFGIKIFPTINWNRVSPDNYQDSNNANYTFESGSPKLRIGLGIIADYYFNENVAFSTGLNYLLSSSALHIKQNGNATLDREYETQFVQLPLALKLITNEITDNIKLYISPGIGVNVLTSATVDGKSTYQTSAGSPVKRYSSDLSLIDINFLGSGGIEYEISNGMKLLIGLTYMHGLLNTNSLDNSYLDKSGFTLKNSVLALDFGIKF